MTRPELRPLTSVRGLFAWGVVCYHVRLACVGWAPAGLIHAMGRGYLGVDFFFLLSGFVIWLNYGHRLGGRDATVDFLVRRLARIWPLHATMLAVGAALALMLAATGRPTPQFPAAQLPLHLAMMQDWGFSNAQAWNDPAWSISAEWMAYLLLPLAMLALPRRAAPTPVLMLCAALPPLGLAALLAPVHGGLGYALSDYGMLRCLAEFSCGAMLCALWRRWRGDVRAEAACWVAGFAAFASWWAGVPETIAVPFAFAAWLLGLALGAERPRHPLGGRVVHWLGEVSYATYLSHYLLFFAFKLAFVRDAANVSPALVALYLLLVLGASAALYHLVERPAQRVVLRAWRNRHAQDAGIARTA